VRSETGSLPSALKEEGGINMNVQRLGFISLLASTLVLGCFLHAWSATQEDERESYKKEVKEKLNGLDKKIDELNKKGAERKGDAKRDFSKGMIELRKIQKVAKKECEKVEHAFASDWGKAKADMDSAVQDVEGAYDKAASHFKEHKD
jgi:hypothetical protein